MTDLLIELEVHPAAELFPLIQGAEFEALVEDIRINGQMEPVVIDCAGRLIDGRNRARACRRLGIVPEQKIYMGDNVLQYVISHNLHRRHLTDSQRAMIAAKLATRPIGGNRSVLASRDLVHMNEVPPSRAEAAEMLSVSESSVQKAKIVNRDGTPELQDLVATGSAPVATAARVAELHPDDQRDYVAMVKAGADPVRAAPPSTVPKDRRPPAPPKYGGNRRKHLEQIEAVITGVSGYVMAFDEVTVLDVSVTAEEATRLMGDLSTQIGALRRIHNLIKERTK